jgi:putative membrane protein
MKTLLLIFITVLGAQVSYLVFGTETQKTEKFITEQIDSQLMDLEEATLALQRGASDSVRAYGDWMLKDHSRMLADLKVLAIQKNVVIPNQLSKQKTEGLSDLMDKHEHEFDLKFVKMMTIDHKRDVCCLKQATKSADPDVKKFAEEYLPVLEKQLKGIKEVHAGLKKAGTP